jgi:hypothetical protein
VEQDTGEAGYRRIRIQEGGGYREEEDAGGVGRSRIQEKQDTGGAGYRRSRT